MNAGTAGSDRSVTLHDGRTLGWRELGASDGFPLIALHGTPGSRFKYASGHEAARKHGLRLISLDRWGYGTTSTHPRPSLAGYGEEIEQFADRMGIEHMSVMGVSGGGPFAAASAARLGHRTRALALVAPVGPMDSALPWRDMTAFHWACFRVLPHVPGAIRLPFAILRALSARAPSLAVKAVSLRAASADRSLLADPDVSQELARTFATGLAPGTDGPAIDMRLFAGSWDVDLGAVSCPGRMWLGTADRNVPISTAHRLATMTRAQTIALDGHGHYWLSRNFDHVFSWIAASV